MLFLGASLNAALIFSPPISGVPVSSGAPNPAAAATYGHQARLEARGALVSSNEALSLSDAPARLPTNTDHEPDCFPPGSDLPNANAEDCTVMINTIIVGMKDPFEEQTWGFTDDEDINLSLPKYRWVFKNCIIRVKNIDEDQIDVFRPIDVAELAQKVVQDCVFGTKSPLGGTAEIGHLEFPLSFYVVVSGSNRTPAQSLRNVTVLSLPPDGLRTLESRASPMSPQDQIIPSIPTEGLNAGEWYPVRCFDPDLVHTIKHAVASDCTFIINEIIVRLPNPMLEQTFGYTDADDIDLSIVDNRRWIHGQCAVFVRSLDKNDRDRFRFVDVAYTALRIVEKCVERSKYAIGGTAGIGSFNNKFYIGIGGIGGDEIGNSTSLGLASDARASSSLQATPAISSSHRTNDTVPANLGKRSNDITEFLQSTNGFAPPVTCLQPGAPTARKIDMQDCTDAAWVLLSDPKVLLPQPFTTEATGGIKMPFVQHYGSCFLMMDTKSELSISVSIPLLKMVYWALEIMLKCVARRALGIGGESQLDDDKEIVVSVTGVDPTSIGNRLASLSQSSAATTNLENTCLPTG